MWMCCVVSSSRNELAQALRSNPFQVSLLIGGFDEGKGPGLYYMDYMASMQKVEKAAHGYCSYFCLRYVEEQEVLEHR
jgi:20S proteasome subunit beta 4